MKAKCIDASINPARKRQLVMDKVYEVQESGSLHITMDNGERWARKRFKILKDDDEDYEPVPVTLKSPTRATNNEVDSQELMDFFSRPQPGNCKCGGPKAKCPYHKDQP